MINKNNMWLISFKEILSVILVCLLITIFSIIIVILIATFYIPNQIYNSMKDIVELASLLSIFLLLLYQNKIRKSAISEVGFKNPFLYWKTTFIGILGSCVILILNFYLLDNSTFLNKMMSSFIFFHIPISTTNINYALSRIFLLNMFWEELVFRGFFQSRIMNITSRFWGIVITSIFFIFYHVFIYHEIKQLFSIILISMWIGFIYSRNRNIFSSYLCHFIYNFLLYLLFY
jgi:membrane protease YdiL (CAAX protease family)